MEKSNIVRILPKKKPWELQRYALSSFKFKDVDKNPVRLATPQQMKQVQNLLQSVPSQQNTLVPKLGHINIKILISAFVIAISYTAVLWALLQPIINPIIFVPTFYIAVAFCIILGKTLSQK